MSEPFRKLKLKELNRVSPEAYQTIEKLPILLVLDNIRSLHNIGAIFRTADAFLIREIWLVGITAQPPHREIQKTALGATETVAWRHFSEITEAVQSLTQLKANIICLEQSTSSVAPQAIEVGAHAMHALVFGNEVEGVSNAFMEVASQVMEIPQEGTKHSLNVSVAAGIAIWELFKKLNN